VIAEGVLNGRARVALCVPHLFEDLAVLALEAVIDGGVVAIIEVGSDTEHVRGHLFPPRNAAWI
jgi:hypothetical protein